MEQLALDLAVDAGAEAGSLERAAGPYQYRLDPEKAFQLKTHIWLSPDWVTFAAQEVLR